MRPKTKEYDKLDDGVRVRLTKLEKKLLVKRCKEEGYRNMSDFCRAKLVKRREVRKVEVSEEFMAITKKIDYDLCKIGANLNQLAKAINTHSVYQFDEHDRNLFEQILSKLKDCIRAFETIIHLNE